MLCLGSQSSFFKAHFEPAAEEILVYAKALLNNKLKQYNIHSYDIVMVLFSFFIPFFETY